MGEVVECVASGISAEIVGVGEVLGSCIEFHCGCEPLTMLVWVTGVLVPVPFVPPVPLLVAVGVTNEVLLASMVGVLVTDQEEAPSEVRA